MTIDVDTLSSRELATCVDEFFKRAMQTIRGADYDGAVTLRVEATQYGRDSEYSIAHKAVLGSEYGGMVRTTNNLIQSAQRVVSDWTEDQYDKPTQVRPLITHQPEPPQEPVAEAAIITEDADFVDIGGDDDDPFDERTNG